MSDMENITKLAQAEAKRRGGLSEDALALLFAAQHGEQLRYVASWSRWLQWDGVRWQYDNTLHVYDMIRTACRDALGSKASKKFDAKTVAGVERLAKSDRRVAATVDQWDQDQWAVNTPGGVVDLKSGKLRAARREDYITKCTAVTPGGDCPQWLAFLDRAMGRDGDLRLFLQRVAGYSLTGITYEHALFFGYGTGGNGKNVFINTIAGLIGDYAATAPMETFIARNTDHHPTDLAGLRGARLVTASETEEGRRWAESRIKALTGGDSIAARFMRQDFFTYSPQFKLFIIGNHKPSLRAVDEAIRRRMNLIPFTVTIPLEERDEKLSEKLKSEWPGILAWMIEGCLEWQGEGLAQPEAVRNATDQYLAAEDAIALWLDECCTQHGNDSAASSALFLSWRTWAERAGEFVGNQKRFTQALEDRGFVRKHARTGARFLRLAVKPQEPEHDRRSY
jgi:putative DNA primase/helicase